MIHGVLAEVPSLLIGAVFFPAGFSLFNETILRVATPPESGRRIEKTKKKTAARQYDVLKTGTFRWFNADNVVHPSVRGVSRLRYIPLSLFFFLRTIRKETESEKKEVPARRK